MRQSGALLRNERKSRGLSVREASLRSAVSPATWKRWEGGVSTPRPADLDRILASLESGSIPQAHLRTRPVLRLLRYRRTRRFLTLEEIGAATGLSLASIQRYETGSRVPDEQDLVRLSAACGLTEDEGQFLVELLSKRPAPPDPANNRPTDGLPSPHAVIYAKLESLVDECGRLENHALESRLFDLLAELSTIGDWESAAEVLSMLRPHLAGLHLGADDWSEVRTLANLLRLHGCGTSHEKRRIFAQSRERFRFGERPSSVSTAFSLLRMAEIVREHDEAEELVYWLSQNEAVGQSQPLRFFLSVHEALTALGRGDAKRQVPVLESLVEHSRHPSQEYTAKAALVQAFFKLGDTSKTSQTVADCKRLEALYGFGSPFLRSVARREFFH